MSDCDSYSVTRLSEPFNVEAQAIIWRIDGFDLAEAGKSRRIAVTGCTYG
jgi:hypothetical protein